jgi:hypothetical protein
VAKIIFASLVLDLTAFTCILPLFPRLVEHFMRDQDRSWLLASILDRIRQVRLAIGASKWSHSGWAFLASTHGSYVRRSSATNPKWDVVLLGGLLGSLFSAAQFAVSPTLGSWSDRYGRKRVLLLTMIGNVASSLLWLASTSFDASNLDFTGLRADQATDISSLETRRRFQRGKRTAQCRHPLGRLQPGYTGSLPGSRRHRFFAVLHDRTDVRRLAGLEAASWDLRRLRSQHLCVSLLKGY